MGAGDWHVVCMVTSEDPSKLERSIIINIWRPGPPQRYSRVLILWLRFIPDSWNLLSGPLTNFPLLIFDRRLRRQLLNKGPSLGPESEFIIILRKNGGISVIRCLTRLSYCFATVAIKERRAKRCTQATWLLRLMIPIINPNLAAPAESIKVRTVAVWD